MGSDEEEEEEEEEESSEETDIDEMTFVHIIPRGATIVMRVTDKPS